MSGAVTMAVGVIRREFRVQLRSGLTALYLGMPLVWILISRAFPLNTRSIIVVIGIYADPVMLGTIFTGAFLTRERDQGLFAAWAVTALDAGGWLIGRVLVIAVQGCLGGLILALGAGVSVDLVLLVPALFLASVCGALNGLLIARPFRDIMSFFVAGGFLSSIICLPVAGGYLSPGWIWLFTGPAWPGWNTLASAAGLATPESGPRPGTSLLALACWAVVLFLITRRIYDRGFFHRQGGGGE